MSEDIATYPLIQLKQFLTALAVWEQVKDEQLT